MKATTPNSRPSDLQIGRLSAGAQAGLYLWAQAQHGDPFLWDAIGGNPEAWAWVIYQLKVSGDRPEWFPKGKWATIQAIEEWIYEEARALVR